MWERRVIGFSVDGLDWEVVADATGVKLFFPGWAGLGLFAAAVFLEGWG